MPLTVQRKAKVETPAIVPHDPLVKKVEVPVKQQQKVIPKVKDVVLEDSDEEDEISMESIVRDKPSPKKVCQFIQACINEIMREDDSTDDSETTDFQESEY
jgi:hypothetical protein